MKDVKKAGNDVKQVDTQANAAPRAFRGMPPANGTAPSQRQAIDAMNARAAAHNAVPDKLKTDGAMRGGIENPDPGLGVVTDLSEAARAMGTTTTVEDFMISQKGKL